MFQSSYQSNYPTYSEDPEDHICDYLNEDTDKSVRMAFVRKVFLILTIQILITVGIASCCFLIDAVSDFLVQNSWIFWVSIILYFTLSIVLICFDKAAKTTPWNFILLGMFTIATSIMIGSSITFGNYDGKLVLVALGLTLLVTFLASIFACQTKYDFTGWGTGLMIFLLCLVAFIILQFFFRNQILGLIIAVAGAFLMTMYIIYDTQLIVGGKHRKHQLTTDQYIFGTLTLYIDIINLFLFILSCMSGGGRDNN